MKINEINQYPLYQKTFGGLTKTYYFRQLVFGAVISAIVLCGVLTSDNPRIGVAFWAIANAVFYPYARFVYETAMGFILGNNVFILPAIILIPWKVVTMWFCWCMALLIAPIGLAGLYIYFTYQEKKAAGTDN